VIGTGGLIGSWAHLDERTQASACGVPGVTAFVRVTASIRM
jgi:hypothetical protein